MNAINSLRGTSNFESYEPSTDNQENAKQTLQRLAEALAKTEYTSDGLNRDGFKKGALIVLSGTPGTGKSHLAEAFAQSLIAARPDLKDAMFFSRGELLGIRSLHFGRMTADNKAIIIIDDAYAKRQSVAEFDEFDVQSISSLMTMVYEERRLCILTTNFPFKEGILDEIRKMDKIGRIVSRCSDLLADAGEYDTTGPDYRQRRSNKPEGTPFNFI